MRSKVDTLFETFVEARERGEHVDVAALLDRAGYEREPLGLLIDAYLRSAPVQPPSEETTIAIEARLSGEPALLVLRQRRSLRRSAVVEALIERLGLDPSKRKKVDGYYHRLETGLLEPAGVDRSVWEALGRLFRANVRSLAGASPVFRDAQTAYLRRADFALFERELAAPAAAEWQKESPAEVDEIDRLFTRGN